MLHRDSVVIAAIIGAVAAITAAITGALGATRKGTEAASPPTASQSARNDTHSVKRTWEGSLTLNDSDDWVDFDGGAPEYVPKSVAIGKDPKIWDLKFNGLSGVFPHALPILITLHGEFRQTIGDPVSEASQCTNKWAYPSKGITEFVGSLSDRECLKTAQGAIIAIHITDILDHSIKVDLTIWR